MLPDTDRPLFRATCKRVHALPPTRQDGMLGCLADLLAEVRGRERHTYRAGHRRSAIRLLCGPHILATFEIKLCDTARGAQLRVDARHVSPISGNLIRMKGGLRVTDRTVVKTFLDSRARHLADSEHADSAHPPAAPCCTPHPFLVFDENDRLDPVYFDAPEWDGH